MVSVNCTSNSLTCTHPHLRAGTEEKIDAKVQKQVQQATVQLQFKVNQLQVRTASGSLSGDGTHRAVRPSSDGLRQQKQRHCARARLNSCTSRSPGAPAPRERASSPSGMAAYCCVRRLARGCSSAFPRFPLPQTELDTARAQLERMNVQCATLPVRRPAGLSRQCSRRAAWNPLHTALQPTAAAACRVLSPLTRGEPKPNGALAAGC